MTILQRDEVVHLFELDLLALELLMDAPQAFDSPVDLRHRNLRLAQFCLDRRLQALNQALGRPALGVDLGAQRLKRLRLEISERQLLELVLDLAHPEAVGDGRVDVARLLRDSRPALLRQVAQGPHVVHAVGELDENHPDVVDHRQEHLAEVFRLAFLGGRERDGADFRDAFDDMRDFRAEKLLDAFDARERVFDDVVEEPGGDGDGVELEFDQELGDSEGVDEVGLT